LRVVTAPVDVLPVVATVTTSCGAACQPNTVTRIARGPLDSKVSYWTLGSLFARRARQILITSWRGPKHPTVQNRQTSCLTALITTPWH